MKLKIFYTTLALSAKQLNSLPQPEDSPTLFVEGLLDMIDPFSELPSSLDDLEPAELADYLDERADTDSQANWPLYFDLLDLPADTKLKDFTNFMRSADPDFLNRAAAADDESDQLLRDAFSEYVNDADSESTSGTSQLTFGSLVALGVFGFFFF